MKRRLVEVAASKGISLGWCSDKNDLLRLITRLHPVETQKPLIRMGSEGDGGYLVPDDLDGLVACFSPGVDVIASFEYALADRGIPCFLADASVAAAPVEHLLINFQKKFLGVIDDEQTIMLDSWVRQFAPPQGDLILQMDIEGAEWVVLLNVSDEVLSRFRIIVLELHGLDRLVDRTGFSFMAPALERLLRLFHVVHNHPNNVDAPITVGDIVIPRLTEITLLRRDRSPALRFATEFPHPLDHKNVPDREDLILPAIWHGNP